MHPYKTIYKYTSPTTFQQDKKIKIKIKIIKHRFRLNPGYNCSGVGAFPFQYIRNLKQNEAHSARAESTHKGVISTRKDNYTLVEYLLFTRVPGQGYRRRLRSLLLCLCYVFRALINSLVC